MGVFQGKKPSEPSIKSAKGANLAELGLSQISHEGDGNDYYIMLLD